MPRHEGKRFISRVFNECRHEFLKCLLAQLATVLFNYLQARPQ